MTTRPVPESRDQYSHFAELQTRWSDNDIYGHVNNAVYYEFFDKLVNDFLITRNLINIHDGGHSPIGLVVETGCHYFAPIVYPETVQGGLCVDHIGNSSVEYGIGLFQSGGRTAAAQGRFVHVYVNAQTRKPEALSEEFREALSALSRD
ncbi:MAG: acyl-CoA thioesterase [Parvibaculales bacterium]